MKLQSLLVLSQQAAKASSYLLLCFLFPQSCYNKNTIDWVSFSQFWWLKVQYQSASKYSVLWVTSSCFIVSLLLTVSSCGRRGKRELSGVFFIRALTLSMRAPPSLSNHFPKISPRNTTPLQVRFLTYEFQGDTNIQYITPGLFLCLPGYIPRRSFLDQSQVNQLVRLSMSICL